MTSRGLVGAIAAADVMPALPTVGGAGFAIPVAPSGLL
jgi:hypothetical protein